jgi:hypothetical protein
MHSTPISAGTTGQPAAQPTPRVLPESPAPSSGCAHDPIVEQGQGSLSRLTDRVLYTRWMDVLVWCGAAAVTRWTYILLAPAVMDLFGLLGVVTGVVLMLLMSALLLYFVALVALACHGAAAEQRGHEPTE